MGKSLLNPFRETVRAGAFEVFPFSGRQFYLSSVLVPVGLVFLDDARNELGDASGAEDGFSVTLSEGVRAIRVITPIDQEIVWWEAAEGVNLNKLAGSLTTQQEQASTISNDLLTLTATAEEVIAASGTRMRVIVTSHRENAGLVFLGGSALDADNAAVVLEPGEVFEDTIAAGAARYAMAATAGDRIALEVSE